MLPRKTKTQCCPRSARRIERAHERKAAPRCNGLGNKLRLLLLYTLPLRICRPPQAKGPIARDWRGSLLGHPNPALPQSAFSLTRLFPFDIRNPALASISCETFVGRAHSEGQTVVTIFPPTP